MERPRRPEPPREPVDRRVVSEKQTKRSIMDQQVQQSVVQRGATKDHESTLQTVQHKHHYPAGKRSERQTQTRGTTRDQQSAAYELTRRPRVGK